MTGVLSLWAPVVLTATVQLPFGQATQVPEPVKEKPKPWHLPGELSGPHAAEPLAMHAWYCGIAGNEEKLPCLVQKMRTMPEGEEKAALLAKIREVPKGGTGSRESIATMHDSWCAMEENAKSQLCVRWMESASRRKTAATERKEAPTRKSEYVDMHMAYCDENPKNYETFPCLTHRLRAGTLSAEEKAKLLETMKELPKEQKDAQRNEMLKFWCEDPATNRAESGVCLSWRKRRQMADLHTPEKLKMLGETPDPAQGAAAALKGKGKSKGADFSQMRGELERMHEWYCTSLDGTHDQLLCARWRLRLKGAVEAYDAVAREKDEKMVKEMGHAQGERVRTLQKQLHESKETTGAEETARLEAELKKARRESQHNFFEMHRLWCTAEGKGKDEPESPACKRWREWMVKSEL